MPSSLNRIALTSIVLCALVTAVHFSAQAEPGVFDDRIVFGQSAAFKGPAAALGLGMRQGILAAFEEANAAGGVNGRKLELVSYNDDYEPNKAIENTKRLIQEDKVFALIGEVGTPTSKAARIPWRMPRPSAAAGPLKAADWPNTIRSSKTPGSACAEKGTAVTKAHKTIDVSAVLFRELCMTLFPSRANPQHASLTIPCLRPFVSIYHRSGGPISGA